MSGRRPWLQDAKSTTDPSDELALDPDSPEERPHDEEGVTTHLSQVERRPPPPEEELPADDTITELRDVLHR